MRFLPSYLHLYPSRNKATHKTMLLWYTNQVKFFVAHIKDKNNTLDYSMRHVFGFNKLNYEISQRRGLFWFG